MRQHTRAGSPQSEHLTPEFIERYAVVGSTHNCVKRLQELEAIGLERLIVLGPGGGADRDGALLAQRHFAEEVLPALRS